MVDVSLLHVEGQVTCEMLSSVQGFRQIVGWSKGWEGDGAAVGFQEG